MDISEPSPRQGFLTWGVHCSGGAQVSSLTSALTQHTGHPPTTSPPQAHLHAQPTATSAGRPTAPAAIFKSRSALEEKKPLPNGASHFHALSLKTTGLETVRPWKGLPSQLPSLSRGLETAAAGRGLTPPRKPGPAVEAWRAFLLPVGGLRSSWEGNRQQASAAELTPGSRHRASGSRGAASASLTDPQAAAAAAAAAAPTTRSHFSDAQVPPPARCLETVPNLLQSFD